MLIVGLNIPTDYEWIFIKFLSRRASCAWVKCFFPFYIPVYLFHYASYVPCFMILIGLSLFYFEHAQRHVFNLYLSPVPTAFCFKSQDVFRGRQIAENRVFFQSSRFVVYQTCQHTYKLFFCQFVIKIRPLWLFAFLFRFQFREMAFIFAIAFSILVRNFFSTLRRRKIYTWLLV